MRKTLAILLCVAMIVSMLLVGVSAADGTAINTAADFAAMTADGKYYLNADIKIDATYVTAFTGTFDGNGHTVTVTVPMFADFNGVVMNLTIDGTEISGAQDLAAFAIYSSEGMTAVNVVNKVDINVTGISADKLGGLNAGGILANAEIFSSSIFRGCVNYGNITVQTAEIKDTSTGAHYETHAGGIAGRVDGVEFKYCENHGLISTPSINGQAGGMVARAAYNASLVMADFIDCTNTADITSGMDAAGMVANLGIANNAIYTPYIIKNCVNTGDISGGYRAGGFVGYGYAGSNQNIELTSSVNLGDVKGGRPNANLAGTVQYAYISLFIGYSNSVNNVIRGCLAVGELLPITGENYAAPFRVIMGCSSAKTADMQLSDNYICDNNTTEWYSYATAEANSTQIISFTDPIVTGKITRCTSAELQGGSILDKLNAAADSAVFSQKIGTDLYPTIDMTLRDQRAAADVFVIEEETTAATTAETTTAAPKETTAKPADTTAKPADTTAKPADTTVAVTTAPVADKGGCGSVFAGGIAIIAILGSAIVIGKKH